MKEVYSQFDDEFKEAAAAGSTSESTPIAAAAPSPVSASSGGVIAAIDNSPLRATDVLHTRNSKKLIKFLCPSQSRTLLVVWILSSVLRAKNSLSKSSGPYSVLNIPAHRANTPWFSFPISLAARSQPSSHISRTWGIGSMRASRVLFGVTMEHAKHLAFEGEAEAWFESLFTQHSGISLSSGGNNARTLANLVAPSSTTPQFQG
ncbi:hypothetical protein QCA50_007094 [Cerrena zonata]|uniref:Uncharacterized protein n=1 Tax=Cerrena zonata TaxID=2478898 RepID=A0AAW0G6L3_9APHY